ncbi:MAG: A/G-specific adenine glycosylase [Rhizobiales bacterium 65-9]|nr:A/G-specific adenine glycosylase [Hyphomicrobiales bacterium]OJY34735.1 MAG: A/G-specific adenine glycosylase [Rhizobiales bacterium 65-9]
MSAAAADPRDLLAWYDRHARDLPWRVRGGRQDPYRVWLSEIMLQQTTVQAVKPYYDKFLTVWPTVGSLAAAPVEDVMKAWAGLGYYSRARNLHACAIVVSTTFGGAFPDAERELRELPGVGAYTAAAIAAIAFDAPATVVDGNVERVVSRLFAIEDELPKGRAALRRAAETLTPRERAGDFAQAMMDLGATICTPRKPACALCPWMEPCAARRRGDQESFPRKAKKRAAAMRYGAAFVAFDPAQRLLVRTRPPKGLLGGMTEVPTSEWAADFVRAPVEKLTPLKAAWRKTPEPVTHVFTHFPLTLDVYVARLPSTARAPEGMRWIGANEIAGEAFPNLFRKVLAAAGSTSAAPPLSIRSARARKDRSRPD